MSIVIEAHIQTGSLLADGIDRIPPGTRVEFDGVVPVREVPLPYLRIRGTTRTTWPTTSGGVPASPLSNCSTGAPRSSCTPSAGGRSAVRRLSP
ncbi:hypothetical protein [Haloplanus sp. GCM10025708]|uniref:hypothetical protein n=1 Tax=Haloplanus sp. GCM10025708 TaxID=3252679 RepID=UPI0036D3EE50